MNSRASIGTCTDTGEPHGVVQAWVYDPPQFHETTHGWEDGVTNPATIIIEVGKDGGLPSQLFFVTPEQAQQLGNRLHELAAELQQVV